MAQERIITEETAAELATKHQIILDALPTWNAVSAAIDAADTIPKLRVVIKKLAKVVYWLAKNQQD